MDDKKQTYIIAYSWFDSPVKPHILIRETYEYIVMAMLNNHWEREDHKHRRMLVGINGGKHVRNS